MYINVYLHIFLFLDLAPLRPPSVVLLHFPSPSSWRKPKKSYSIFSVCCRPPPPPLGLPSPHGETGHVRFPAPKIAEVVAAAAEVKRKGNRREGEKELLCSQPESSLVSFASVRCNIRAKQKVTSAHPHFEGSDGGERGTDNNNNNKTRFFR